MECTPLVGYLLSMRRLGQDRCSVDGLARAINDPAFAKRESGVAEKIRLLLDWA
ncbi:MAG TPA: hypothetical protein VN708_16965 [Terriglobales bacterium]|nr:hypothetical protein [Terriglobales bacterium]